MLWKTGIAPPRSPKSSVRQPTSNSRSAPSTYSTSPTASAALMKSSNDEYGIPAPPKCYLRRAKLSQTERFCTVDFVLEVIYHLHHCAVESTLSRSIISSSGCPVTRVRVSFYMVEAHF